MTKKFFFMAAISAALQGRPQVQFNTITSLNDRNITARSLDMIQGAAADMINGQVEYDDLVIQNIFCLTPDGCDEDEFVAGTALADQLTQRRAAEAAANLSQEALVEAAGQAQELAADADASAEAEDALSATDNSELDAQAVESTVGDTVSADDTKLPH